MSFRFHLFSDVDSILVELLVISNIHISSTRHPIDYIQFKNMQPNGKSVINEKDRRISVVYKGNFQK